MRLAPGMLRTAAKATIETLIQLGFHRPMGGCCSNLIA